MKQVINTTDTNTDTAKSGFDKANANFTELYDKTSNVDNTPDSSKPISTDQQNALNLKENLTNKAMGFSIINDFLYPSVQAVKTFVENMVVGLLKDRGSFDASPNVFPSTGGSGSGGSIKKGDLWFISVPGNLGGEGVTIGDSVRALVDDPAQTPSNWSIIQVNITYVPENSANKDTDGTLSANSDQKYASQKATRTFVEAIRDTLISMIGLKGYTLVFSFNSISPADNTTYYIGNNAFSAPSSSSSALYRVRAFESGTIKKMNAFVNLSGGSAENVIFRIKNVTTGNIITVTSAQPLNAPFATQYSNLNLAVNAGDELEIHMVCPTWVTNPTGVQGKIELFVV